MIKAENEISTAELYHMIGEYIFLSFSSSTYAPKTSSPIRTSKGKQKYPL